MKVTWGVFICVYCMDKSYLIAFIYAFRFIVLMKVTSGALIYVLNAWNFFIRKNCPDNLNYYATYTYATYT